MKNREVVVVVHDAGGAEVIGAYICKNQKRGSFVSYGSGPAKKVFARLDLPLQYVGESAQELAKVMKRHGDASFALIAAPGWMSATEANAILEAKKAQIKTLVYMDSWVDEKKRFGYPKKDWKKSLPDEFWAGDTYEDARLKKTFPHIPVSFVANQYFKNEIERFRGLKKQSGKPTKILFMSDVVPGSYVLLEHLIRKLNESGKSELLIRFHPADDRKRYDVLIALAKKNVHIQKSRERDIVHDLVQARIVVGPETMALAISALCKIPTICVAPPRTKSLLPFPAIRRVSGAEEAIRLI